MVSQQRKRPNFIFIGPDKAGSTWLYRALKFHPQAYLPSAKELFFFDRFYDRGWDWYLSFFHHAPPQARVLGEISHDYLFSDKACDRIASSLPDVRLMVCLREPCERAFSSYLYMLKQGRISCTFEEAIDTVEELIDHGRYVAHLQRYLARFPRTRLHIAFFDDLVRDPQQFFEGICEFLSLDDVVLPPDLRGPTLPAATPRSRFLAKFARSIGWRIRQLGMPQVVSLAKNAKTLNRLLYHVYQDHEKPKMLHATRNSLQAIFQPEVVELDRLLQLDVSMRWGYRPRPNNGSPSYDATANAQTRT